MQLSRELGINPKTVAKWRKRATVEDLKTSPKEPRSTVLTEPEEAMIVAFRRHTLLPLAVHATLALEQAKEAGIGQSLLSMASHEELFDLVNLHGLVSFFDAIQGFGDGSHSKQEHLRTHLNDLGIAAENTALIGDALDDFEASTALGVLPVLVTTGIFSEERLLETGARVEHSMLGALKGLQCQTSNKS